MDYIIFYTQNGCAACNAAKSGTQIAAEQLNASWVERNISNASDRALFEQDAAGITNAVPFVVYLRDNNPIWNSSTGGGIDSSTIVNGVSSQTQNDILGTSDGYDDYDPCSDDLYAWLYADECGLGDYQAGYDAATGTQDEPQSNSNAWIIGGIVIAALFALAVFLYQRNRI
jgi:hypothetical protein